MATFIPNLTDQIPDLPQYQPNLGFFSQMMQRKSAMYEQGYSQVRSAYDSILNAPLTDESNIQTRDTYLKQAEEKLKNLSSLDLSKQENVSQASDVFAPFWQDDLLIKDAAYTKSIQSEIAKGLSLRDSKDKDQRDQYSEVAMTYLANGLEKLKTAGRDKSVYNNLEKRRLVPFVNEKEYWNKQAKDLNFEVNWSDPSGPFLINTKNGQRAEMSFRAFAEGMISPQMEDMYRVMGTVEKEGRIKQVKRAFPNTTDTQAVELIAQDVLKDVRGNYEKSITSLSGEMITTQQKIAEFKKLGELSPAQQNRYTELRDYEDQLNVQLGKKKKEYEDIHSENSANAIDVHNNIVSNPDYYFTKLARSRSVNNWAAAASSNQSRKVEINPVWKEQNDIFYKQEELKFKARSEDREDAKFEWEKSHPSSSKSKSSSESTDENGDYIPSKDEMERGAVLGPGTTDVTRTGTAYDAFTQRQKERLSVANESVFSMEGLGRVAATLPGVSQQDVITYFSAVKKGQQLRDSGEGTQVILNPQEKQAQKNLYKSLKDKTGIDITGPGTLRNALIDYSKKYFADKSKDGGLGLAPEDITSLLKYNLGAQAMQEFSSLEQKKNELLKKQITSSTDPDIQKLVVNRNGQKDIVNSNDLKPYLKSSYQVLDNDSNVKTFTPNQLAQAYLKGKVGWGTSGGSDNPFSNASIGEYPIIDGVHYQNPQLVKDIKALQKRFGKGSDIAKTYDKINTSIVPNIPEYNNQTGKMGVNFEYQMDGKVTKGGTEKATRLVQEITEPSNRSDIFIDGKSSKDTELIKAMDYLGKLGEQELEKYFSSVVYKTVGVNGGRSLKLTLKPIKTSDKTEVAGLDLNKLVGKDIEIAIAPDAKGPIINSLPANEGNYIYQSILRGKPLRSDPIMSSANFSYEILPDDTSNPTKAYVNITRKKFNVKSGKYEDVSIPTGTIDFFGSNKKTPDELVAELYNMFRMHLTENSNNEKLYQKNNQGTNKTASDIDAQRQSK